MNPTKHKPALTLAAAGLFVSATLGVASQTGTIDRIREFISEGNFSLNLRPRYEMVDKTDDETAHAITLGTRIGYTTREWRGFKAMFELDNVASPFPNAYNQSQLNPGGASKAIVTDPTGTGVNQAWLRFDHGRFSVTAGRQRLNFDNGRFIGDMGWRQNMQTFDAALIEHRTTDDLSLAYAYLWRVNRVYGDDHPQGVYDSNSHALHATYTGLKAGTITAYTYLLDFDGAAVANSCATYGVSFDGRRTLGRFDVGYRAEYAFQTDFGSSPLAYGADYLAAEINAGIGRYAAGIGYELQGTDNNFPFRTPLGSLHEFNGWADVFLLTPVQGLRDTYGRISARLPWWEIGVLGYYHTFSTDTGLSLGSEIDLQATYQINESLGAAIKLADFKSDAGMVDDVTKLWLQLELKY